MDGLLVDLLARAEDAYRYAVADPAAASDVASEVVAQARREEHTEALVVGLRAQAWSALRLLAGDQAKSLLDEAARVARQAGLPARLGEVLISRAAVNHELGRARAAGHDLDRARPLLSVEALAELDLQRAALFQNAGRLADAAEIYRRLLAASSTPADVRAKASNNLGMIEAQFGHYGEALGLVADAMELARAVGPALTAFFANGRAWVTANAGRLPQSLDLFEQAGQLYEVAGLPQAELHAEYADAMSDLRLLPEATDAARRAAQEFEANGVVLMRAEAELRVARLALLAGDLDTAADTALRAEETLRRQRRTGWAASAVVIAVEARALAGTASPDDLHRVRRAAGTLARLHLTAGAVEAHLTAARVAVMHDRAAWAHSSLAEAEALARGGPILLRLKGRLAGGSAAALAGDHRLLLQHCRAGLADLDRHRAALASTELRVRASAHGSELGHMGLRSLVQSGSPLEVFQWMERTRAAALLGVQRSYIAGVEEELAVLRSVQAEIESTGATPALVARQAALENHVRRATWAREAELPSVTKPPPIGKIRGLLGGRVLVEYGVLDDRVIAVIVAPRKVVLVRLGALAEVQSEVEGLFFVLRLLARPTARSTGPALSKIAEQRLGRLRALLVQPLELPVRDAEVVVVPSGSLQRVPWSALYDVPVSVSPSAAFWVRAAGRPRPTGEVLLVGGPGLPAVAEEISRLALLYGEGSVLQSPDSTVHRVAESLRSAALVHFACHGLVRADNPMFSGLLLADGSLTVQELELRDLAPHRIVLAACEAAADAVYPGGETLGFVSALLARGTAGLVASTILVPDAAATPIMVTLHEHIHRGETLATSLHAARSTIDLDDPHGLVNWCGFTAYGAA